MPDDDDSLIVQTKISSGVDMRVLERDNCFVFQIYVESHLKLHKEYLSLDKLLDEYCMLLHQITTSK